MNFKDIRQITQTSYAVNVEFGYFVETIKRYIEQYGLNLDPDYQRGYVWTDKNKSSYIENMIRGVTTGRDIYLNCPGWMNDFRGPMEVVDGKQRIHAISQFMNDMVHIFPDKANPFGYTLSQFTGNLPDETAYVIIHIANLSNRKDVLQWYIDLNTGGTVHSDGEIERVKRLLENEK